jgi:Tfp pilus assembly protein PilN
MNEGINLLDPNKQSKNSLPAKRLQLMRYFAIGMLFLVSASSVILFMLVSLSPLPELQRQEQELRLTLSQSSEDMAKLVLLDERATAIESLLQERKSYKEVLTLLQDTLSDNAQITSLRVDGQTLVVTVESRSLTSLDAFLNGLIGYVQQQKAFSQVKMTQLAHDNVRNDYSMTVSLGML